MRDIFRLEGKNIVVTGGAGLIGKEICTYLCEYGANVIIGELDLEKAEKFKNELKIKGFNCEALQLDITSEESVNNFLKRIDESFGDIHGWVNNAYPRTSDWGEKFENIELNSWRKNVDMHLNGYFLCCQKIAEKMKNQKLGSIINLASIYGMVGPNFSIYDGTNMTMPAAYSAIKGGIINFTKYLATYYGKYGVRANVIAPGGIFDNQNPAFIEKYEKLTPLGRMGKASDIAPAAIYLLSDASEFVTGHTLVIDGGWTAW